ncbi:MAG: restriction endonuclease [Bacillus sp. (in: Bacteria)]|nr:restriction endonuclease [Bacillus sp. (in: firmicutes)]
MNRGYAGFYKGYYLRSSYEYAYAKYLDYFSVSWSYEDRDFDIEYKIYKPDFFFYNEIGQIIKIVEIKSRHKIAKNQALMALNVIKEKYGIEVELISYEELLILYKKLPFSLTSTISEWIDSEHTTVNKKNKGKLNGHYNIKHSNTAKMKIGNHTKKLWESDSVSKKRMLEGLRNSGLSQKGKVKTPRQFRCCLNCGIHFKVLITSSKKYCSRKCSGKIAIKLATNSYIEKRFNIHLDIRRFVINWCKENNDLVNSTPLNKISTTIKPLLDDINKNFSVKDIRVISKAIFGVDRGRKELLNFMKKVSKEVQ